jgi:intraflagellar transport protein 122
MRCNEIWADRLLDRDGVPQPVYSVSWLPDGTCLAAAVGSQILIYSSSNGTLVETLRVHRDVVYTIATSTVGSHLISGGADKTVVIWNVSGALEGSQSTENGAKSSIKEPLKFNPAIKYTHNDSIQALSCNPISGAVCSGTATEFGLWNPETKAVTKFKVISFIFLCNIYQIQDDDDDHQL